MDANDLANGLGHVFGRVPGKGNPFAGESRSAGGYLLPLASSEAIYLPLLSIRQNVIDAGFDFPFRYSEGTVGRFDVIVAEEGVLLVCRDKECSRRALLGLQAKILKRFGVVAVPYDLIRRPDGDDGAVDLLRLIPLRILPLGVRERIPTPTWRILNEQDERERYVNALVICAMGELGCAALGLNSVAPMGRDEEELVAGTGGETVIQEEAHEDPCNLCDLDFNNILVCDPIRLEWRVQSEPSRQGGGPSMLSVLGGLAGTKLLLPPKERQVDRLERLKAKLPNFEPVIEFIRGKLLAQCLTRNAMQLPPILLLGDPGVGKSYFSRMLAEALEIHFDSVAVAGSSQALHITGLSKGWGGAGPSRFAEILNLSMHANPLILVDEIDKAGHSQVENALLQVFEPETARRWVDQYVEVPLDLSHVMFVATANDASVLAPALLSRFEVFEISAPDCMQFGAVFQSIYEDELGKLRNCRMFAPNLSGAVISKVLGAAMSPRTARWALIGAMERAVVRTHREHGELPVGAVEILADDMVVARRMQHSDRMGFI